MTRLIRLPLLTFVGPLERSVFPGQRPFWERQGRAPVAFGESLFFMPASDVETTLADARVPCLLLF